jgi:hypothetical protein
MLMAMRRASSFVSGKLSTFAVRAAACGMRLDLEFVDGPLDRRLLIPRIDVAGVPLRRRWPMSASWAAWRLLLGLFRGRPAHVRHYAPVSVWGGGCSCQFGHALAPMIPADALRGPNDGTVT